MPSLLRLGSTVIVKSLAKSHLGSVSRGVVLAGDHAARHVLVRSYDDSLAGPHLEQHRESLARRTGRLAGSRGLGSGHELLPAPHLGYTQDYVPGRTLGQVLARAQEEDFGLGLEQALTLAAGMCQALAQAHTRGLGRGLLGPESVWVGFDGSVSLLDACLAGELEDATAAAAQEATWRPPSSWGPGRRDDQVLGRMLMEMLTGAPMRSCTPERAIQALKTLKPSTEAVQGAEALTEIVTRLLGKQPYPSLGEACRDFDEILAHGDFGPTTFTLAFYMHQAFRQETFHEGVDEKEELGMVFKKKALATAEGMVEPIRGNEGRRRKALLAAAALLVMGGMGGGVAILRSGRVELAQQEAILHSERQRHEQRLGELAKAEAELTARMQALSAQTHDASIAENMERMERELAEQRKAKEELLRERKKLTLIEPVRAAVAQVAPPKEISLPPAPSPVPITPAPVQILKPAAAPPTSNGGAPRDAEARVLSRGFVPPVIWAEAKNAVPTLRVVRIRVFVDKSGRGLKTLVEQHQGLPPTLEERFRVAALQCAFAPALRGGEPAAGWVVVDFPSA